MKKIEGFTRRGYRRYAFARMASEGGVWELARGEDYIATEASVRQSAYQWARRNGYEVRTSTSPDGGAVEIEFIQKG
jgi:hypothetical protein